jgi:hypothetical protein
MYCQLNEESNQAITVIKHDKRRYFLNTVGENMNDDQRNSNYTATAAPAASIFFTSASFTLFH